MDSFGFKFNFDNGLLARAVAFVPSRFPSFVCPLRRMAIPHGMAVLPAPGRAPSATSHVMLGFMVKIERAILFGPSAGIGRAIAAQLLAGGASGTLELK